MPDILQQIKETVEAIVPSSIEITEIELAGPEVAIYTKNLDEFTRGKDWVGRVAQGLRKRVAIRPDPSLLAEKEEAEKRIKEIVPEEAKISDTFFDPDVGEVTIVAERPGLAIGKKATILNRIKKNIGWAPHVVRAPPIPSKTVKEIRAMLRTENLALERKEFLRRTGRNIYRKIKEDKNWLRITALGGFREVGRSAALVDTKDSKILVDCGLDVSNGSPPYLNAPEVLPLDKLDAVVITHAHLDHSGLVPLLYKYGYGGPVYCTLPTRDLMALLQLDYLKVAVASGGRTPYESKHVKEGIKHCVPLKYGDTTDIAPDIKLTLHNAGHILGSAIVHMHVGEGLHNIVLTGDIKYERTWLFNPACNRFPRMETLVIESTYGGEEDLQPSRKDASDVLEKLTSEALARNGKVIIPVFAVGRSQEVMIVLERLIRLGKIPQCTIYLDGMIWEATAIHAAYPEHLNNHLRKAIFKKGENPFLSPVFKRVDSTEMRVNILRDPKPCIVLATAGMLNGGPVMEYIKAWGEDKKNLLIFVGYQAEGTLGWRIQKGMREISTMYKGKPETIRIELQIATCDGFSGHSDRRQLLNYLYHVHPRPERVIICHGERTKCLDFAYAVRKKYGVHATAPKNLETLRAR